MRVFISYKYSNNENKDGLKETLEKISTVIESWGDSTFILGRDVKKWKHVHFGTIKLIPVIFKNMRKCDIVYAYVDSEVYSKGLFFELFIARLLGLKAILFANKDLNIPTARFLATDAVHIDDYKDIVRVSYD